MVGIEVEVGDSNADSVGGFEVVGGGATVVSASILTT
jgi:hypothetical protein